MREALVDLGVLLSGGLPRPAAGRATSAASQLRPATTSRRCAGWQTASGQGDAGQAAVAYREVLDNAPGDDDAVEIARRLHNSVVKGGAFDHPGDDVGRIVYTLDARLADYRLAAPVRAKLVEEFELYARDLATRAQVAAKDKLGRRRALRGGRRLQRLSRPVRHRRGGRPRSGRTGPSRSWRRSATTRPGRPTPRSSAAATQDGRHQEAGAPQRDRRVPAGPRESGARAPPSGPWRGAPSERSGAASSPTRRPTPPSWGSSSGVARSYYEAGDYETAANLFYAVARQYPSTNEGAAAAQPLARLPAARRQPRGHRDARASAWWPTRGSPRTSARSCNDIVLKAGQRQLAEVTASD